ncbi:MAG: helix-turn-helix transcriptional regulator [Sphingomonadales bacterium]|nr:helix-turn-helix transcriptional regulator [Sphingomonadales bacterium]
MTVLSQEWVEATRIAGPDDIRRAAVALERFARDRGFRVAPTHNIAEKRSPVDLEGNLLARDVFGWEDHPKVWWRNSRLALDSPLTMACRFENEPFWASAEGFRTRLPNPALERINRDNFEARAFARAAIVVPVHMAFGQIGAASFIPLDAARTDLAEDYTRFGDAFGFCARGFLVSYVRVMAERQKVQADPTLSRHEVECLRWAAIGKTDEEICMIMSRSRATIRYHLKNAATKLNAVNRSQTVVKAAQLGYLATRT